MDEARESETQGAAATAEGGRYDHAGIEARWQAHWNSTGLYRSVVDPDRPKYYVLTMLPYPSGDLHIGHWYAMTPPDAHARYKRMRGYNVLFPIGFDAFGLPAENAAIKRGVHPREWTYKNIDRMRGQLRSMGAMFDWRREAVSSDPSYYRWTQWFFCRLFEAGLAYKKHSPVDWCPSCNTTLAREQVWGDDRHCERCETPVIKKNLDQWFFAITRYAEELLDFSGLDWPERVQVLQRNWIGRSQGAEVRFALERPGGGDVAVFTTRPDTLWGVTFLVLAPEHPLVAALTTPERKAEVEAYVAQAVRQTDIQREAADREKTGVFTGGYAVNPASGERVPVWVADYALMTYGTGAVMGVPGHDARDFDFARKYGLEVREVIVPEGEDGAARPALAAAYDGPGVMARSGPLDGTRVPEEMGKVVAWLEQQAAGRGTVTYRLRDWLISRQRFWGAPIPIVYCPEHGQVAVPDDQLPVRLPDDVEWRPTGESPLKLHPTWSRTTCPTCGGPATRDTDTMDTFMCSSWYQYRYLSPDFEGGPWDPAEYAYWMPVDCYTGGIEHATMHLIYTRFFTKALRDLGVASHGEPMLKLRNQGTILGEDAEKMSKSRGNVVAPDELVARYGADAVRTYLMFFARWELGGPWSARGIEGTSRWLNRVWNLVLPGGAAAASAAGDAAARLVRRATHQTLARVTDDFESFQFNTLVAALMEFTNTLYKHRAAAEGTPAWEEALDTLVKMLAPLAPHLAEELWVRRGGSGSVHTQPWPTYDAAAAADETLTLVVQVDGKVRDRLSVPAGIEEAEAKARALATDAVRKRVAEVGEPKQVVYVKGRLVSVVFK